MAIITVNGLADDVTNVRHYGAVGDGVTNDTAAFSAAAQAAPAENNIVGNQGVNIPRAPMCSVIVPAGTYHITSEIDTGNRYVIWRLDQAAIIPNYSLLNGKVSRPGQRQNVFHHGTNDYACTQSFRANHDLDEGAGVAGFQEQSRLTTYIDRDSVGLFVDNKAPAALIDVSSATYTATTVTIAAQSATVLKKIRRGMFIDTKHSPKWSGFVESWNADASVITVSGWYEYGGGGTPATPTDGTGIVVNGFTKVWAQNTNVILSGVSYADRASGFELGVKNERGPLNYATQENYMTGYTAANLGSYDAAIGFQTRNNALSKFFRGFDCDGATQAAYHISGQIPYGFWSEQTSGDPFHFSQGVDVLFKVDINGNIKANAITLNESSSQISIGTVESSNTPLIDFNSSGNNIDYDARLVASGGTASIGQGTLTCNASAGFVTTGPSRPSADNSVASGSASQRWSNVYGTNIRPGAGTVTWTSGSGTPESVVTAVVGSMYTRTDGGASTTLYIKESGSGNTGWAAK